jgi:iron-sulfur cluster repair protein YtfE (RIC family)
MTLSLPHAAREQLAGLMGEIDAIPAMADSLMAATADEARASLAATRMFLTGTLLPHMEASEQTIYPELERMFQNRHSMAPMRREHTEIRRLVAEFAAVADKPAAEPLTLGRTLAVRRTVFQLYALLKIHLAEEDAYLRIVERGVAADVADVLAAAMDHPVAGAGG